MSTENKQQQQDNTVLPLVVGSISSMNEVMKEFLSGIDDELEKDPHNEKMKGAKWAYSIAIVPCRKQQYQLVKINVRNVVKGCFSRIVANGLG